MVLSPASLSDMVWDDILRIRTLNANQSRSRRDQHICPLPFDIVERLIYRYTNVGDVVYDPFAGLGTVPYIAIKLGRFGAGCELSADYFRDAVGYCEAAEAEADAPTLFDLAKEAGA